MAWIVKKVITGQTSGRSHLKSPSLISHKLLVFEIIILLAIVQIFPVNCQVSVKCLTKPEGWHIYCLTLFTKPARRKSTCSSKMCCLHHGGNDFIYLLLFSECCKSSRIFPNTSYGWVICDSQVLLTLTKIGFLFSFCFCNLSHTSPSISGSVSDLEAQV